MLYVPARHEPLQRHDWDEAAAVRMIERIVRDCEERFTPNRTGPRTRWMSGTTSGNRSDSIAVPAGSSGRCTISRPPARSR